MLPLTVGSLGVDELATSGTAGVEEGVELVPDCTQLLDLLIDPGPHRFEPPPLTLTARPTGIVSLEGVDDLVEGEADLLETTHEGKPLHGVLWKQAIVRLGACRRWHHTTALVVTNGVDRHAGQRR